MKIFLLILLIIISVGIITLIMLQPRGSGAGSVFGGSVEVYRSRRGVEKLTHYATIALVVAFCLVAFGLIFAG